MSNTFKTLAELVDENRQLGAIVGRLQEIHGCTTEMVVHWCEHSELRVEGLAKENRELRRHADAMAEAADNLLTGPSNPASATADALDSAWRDYARWKRGATTKP